MSERPSLDALIDALALAEAEDYLREQAAAANDPGDPRADQVQLPPAADAA